MVKLSNIGVFLTITLSSAYPAGAEGLTLTPSSRWLIVNSGLDLDEVKQKAAAFTSETYGVRIARAKNGRFATVLGPFANPDLGTLKAMKNVPPDAYLSTGSNLLETVWVPSGQTNTIIKETQVGRDATMCLVVPDSSARLACYDNVYGYRAQPAPAPATQTAYTPPAAPRDPAIPVAAASQRLAFKSEDYSDNVLNDRVELYFSYANNTSKTVTGIRHKFTVTDAFGDVLVQSLHNLNMRLLPNSTEESSTYLVWEDNPFISNQPFDKLRGPLANNTYKIKDEIMTVIYEDGTTQNLAAN